MKKITFPQMGDMKIGLKALFAELGFEVVVPPEISKNTLDLGVKYGPEFACLPLKINLGNFIEALEKGANVIVMGGGCGPCRFGYYAEVQRAILEDLGYCFEMIVLEPNLLRDYRHIKKILGNISLKRLYNGLKLALYKVYMIDNIYRIVLATRALEKKRGEIDSLYSSFLNKIDQASSFKKIKALKDEYQNKIKENINDYQRNERLIIGIVGEIYLVLEPFVNLNIEEKLGKLGVIVKRDIYMSSWLLHFLHLGNEMRKIKKAAENYLDSFVGGHGLDSIGNTVRYARVGYDGVIQLAPFTCMPEIISQTILPSVSKKEKIPVLSLFFDEHTGDAGLQTRIEAFVDLLMRKKIYKDGKLLEKGINYG
ncbi:MAG: CoA protein activase [Firmicutes bacterium]|nr:CoA protein activase [Bacillota bacterium]